MGDTTNNFRKKGEKTKMNEQMTNMFKAILDCYKIEVIEKYLDERKGHEHFRGN